VVLRLRGGSGIKEQLGFDPDTDGEGDLDVMQQSSEDDEM
jgi:hypothetical protein